MYKEGQRITKSSIYTLFFVQLGQIVATDNTGYQFMDRNNWPIGREQESKLMIIEILVDGTVTVVPSAFTPSTCLSRHGSHDTTDGFMVQRSSKRRR